jgi:hypothetical protein
VSLGFDELPLFETLRSSPGGDVLAARACAREILQTVQADPAPLGNARLILTAMCLHLQGQIGGSVSCEAMLAMLWRLGGQGVAAAGLTQSPLQFVRYVAAELLDSEPASLAIALELAIRAVGRLAY